MTHPEFFFDLACPFTYLAAEQVERAFPGAVWQPASCAALHRRTPDAADAARIRREAEVRAAQLRMPLEWPDRFPAEPVSAMRAAVHAGRIGRGAAFALAAGRLAFCGGFDLDDPEILAEAAAAAGISLDDTLRAARDAALDAVVDGNGRRLLAAGATTLPALRQGRRIISGEGAIGALMLSGPRPPAALPVA